MATLLPNGKQQYCDANGEPLAGGSVYFYIPNTTTFKNTWQDAAQTILNTNPVVLDSAGEAVVYGVGVYRQLVEDSLGNTIWDQPTTDLGGYVPSGSTLPTLSQEYSLFADTSVSTPQIKIYDSADWVAFRSLDSTNHTSGSIGSKLTLASAATVNIGSAAADYIQITGTTTITAFDTIQAGTVRILEFAASLTLTQNATSLILPGAANITTNAGDIAVVVSEGSGNWRCLGYSFAKALPGKQPTRTTLTSGSAQTYTTPAGATRLFIRMVGGGGGGGPAGSVGGAALSGGATSFNSIGAAPGTFGSQTGSPGSGGTGGGGTASLRIPGAWGGVGPELALFGGRGGATQLGPGGAESYGGAAGSSAPANTGGGGGGASSNNTGVPDGAGGGGGEYVELIITSPAASYTYTVGTAGNGGTGGNNGGAGAAGIIIIDEYYN